MRYMQVFTKLMQKSTLFAHGGTSAFKRKGSRSSCDERRPSWAAPRRSCFDQRSLSHARCTHHVRSLIREAYFPDENAPVVDKLLAAGAISLGKTTTPEFGFKGVTDSPLTGVTRNPWDVSKTPGVLQEVRLQPWPRAWASSPWALTVQVQFASHLLFAEYSV